MEPTQFRQALGRFATGVAIVSSRSGDGEAIGMTISSFNSVSVDPPLVLFSIAKTAYTLPALLDAKGYVVNVLSKAQAKLAIQFGRADGKTWTEIPHVEGHERSPLICDSLAAFQCEPYAHYEGGDHVIFVGKVLNCKHAEAAEAPLLFYCGSFRELAPRPLGLG